MGFGDLGCNNPASRIPTPNLDRLAEQGMRFTDAHAGSSVCTPSRYSMLTGRYAWRSRLKRGIVWEWDAPLIEPDRPTVASFLRAQGYRTACLGKWHLGWDWPTLDGRHPNESLEFGINDDEEQKKRIQFGGQIDYSKPVTGGPIERGFDSYFGVDVPNFPPYTWFENDRLTQAPTAAKPADMYGNPGMAAAGWSLQAMIPEFTRRAVNFVESHAGDATPYFLYYPLTSPHSPVVPNEEFRGRSGCGNYGDFVCEVDWVVGQITDALARTGTADDTLLIFTSDNGPERTTGDDIGVYERARTHRHYSMGDLRGTKRDAWEGGHRVPFLASWPAAIAAGKRCDRTICLSDLMATCAEIVGVPLPEQAGEDSVSMLPLLTGHTPRPTRDCIVHHSMSGRFAIREGDWVFIDSPTGGDNQEPDWFREERGYTTHDLPGELFNLQDDLGERSNRYAHEPELAAKLSARLQRIKAGAGAQARDAAADELTE
jgi:arylsulfatase A